MFIPDVINTLLMGLIFMVVIVTVVRPFVLNMVSDAAPSPAMHNAALLEIEHELMRKAEVLESLRADKIKYQMLLLERPPKPKPMPVPEPEALAEVELPAQPSEKVDEVGASDVSAQDALVEATDLLPADAAEVEPAALADGEIEIREGESLAEIKDRIRKEQQKAKKPTIPPELLSGANSYEDKVGIVRMVVQSDQARVASAIRGMIQVK